MVLSFNLFVLQYCASCVLQQRQMATLQTSKSLIFNLFPAPWRTPSHVGLQAGRRGQSRAPHSGLRTVSCAFSLSLLHLCSCGLREFPMTLELISRRGDHLAHSARPELCLGTVASTQRHQYFAIRSTTKVEDGTSRRHLVHGDIG